MEVGSGEDRGGVILEVLFNGRFWWPKRQRTKTKSNTSPACVWKEPPKAYAVDLGTASVGP